MCYDSMHRFDSLLMMKPVGFDSWYCTRNGLLYFTCVTWLKQLPTIDVETALRRYQMKLD